MNLRSSAIGKREHELPVPTHHTVDTVVDIVDNVAQFKLLPVICQRDKMGLNRIGVYEILLH